MDQRQIVQRLEEHFRNEDKALFDQRNRVHEERSSVSDDEWWAELIEQTRSIRPQMVEVFERNKQDMISKRFQTAKSEEDFRLKTIQRRVMDLLPFVSIIRIELNAEGDLTVDQIQLALARKTQQEIESAQAKTAVSGVDLDFKVSSDDSNEPIDLIDSLIEQQLRRQRELN
jgi:hypothetical protein